MKTKKVSQKLTLNKSDIANLNLKEMGEVKGGSGPGTSTQVGPICFDIDPQ